MNTEPSRTRRTRSVSLAVEWRNDKPSGHIEVINGACGAGAVVTGDGTWRAARFAFSKKGRCRIRFVVTHAALGCGPHPTRVTVHNGARTFSFFVRDVNAAYPVLVDVYGVMVVPADDRRSYQEVSAAIRARGGCSIPQRIEQEPEETYEHACNGNRAEKCPTWLGVSRDMRFFEVGHHVHASYWGYVQPRFHSVLPAIAETADKPYVLNFAIGKGDACRHDMTRWLDAGCLPILHARQREEDIAYQLTAFATLERSPLTIKNLRGSEWQACYPHTGGHMLAPGERENLADVIAHETTGREEETVLIIRIRAVNAGKAPCYAWFKTPLCQHSGVWLPAPGGAYEFTRGFSRFASGRVYAIARLDGQPAPAEELAVLLQPGRAATLDILIPHQPLPAARAVRLSAVNIDRKLNQCRAFWRSKLRAGASISVPEDAINDRIKAGLLHCDIAALGREPAGPVLATIGWYAPIGSESAPIIQFFDSMGWHALAERCIAFFLARQRADGFIQNFGGYQLETGPALWTMGEHFRYTRDTAWVRRIKPNVLNACMYLLAWRARNKRPALRGKGYGLLDGKVADPEDFFHSFMLNALSYAGIARVAEMLETIDPGQSRRLQREARAFRNDIRTAFHRALGRAPVIPLGDGTWLPSISPWPEYPGPLALYADGGTWFTHGAFGARDSLLGALYLVIGEVLDAREPGAEIALRSHQQLFTVRNAGLTQPYYVRHDFAHLMRGEIKAFLKTYYNQLTALQDRETYTFWEHYCHASQHKTHEEGWFLMQTRWMLWHERGQTLHLLPGIPRRWLDDGKTITLSAVASYFGPVNLTVRSHLAAGVIKATVALPDSQRLPAAVVVRLPHPGGHKPLRAEGGAYDPATETITIARFRGHATLRLLFPKS